MCELEQFPCQPFLLQRRQNRDFSSFVNARNGISAAATAEATAEE